MREFTRSKWGKMLGSDGGLRDLIEPINDSRGTIFVQSTDEKDTIVSESVHNPRNLGLKHTTFN